MEDWIFNAAINNISYEGDFITDRFKLFINRVDTGEPLGISEYEFITLPSSSTMQEVLFYSEPLQGNVSEPLLLSFEIKHATEEYRVAYIEHQLQPLFYNENESSLTELDLPLSIDEFKGSFKLSYSNFISQRLGRIPELIDKVDCICRYLSSGKSDKYIAAELNRRIRNLSSTLAGIPLGNEPIKRPYPSPKPDFEPAVITYEDMEGPPADGGDPNDAPPRYAVPPCVVLARIKTRLQAIVANPNSISLFARIQIRILVDQLLSYFGQMVGFDYCDNNNISFTRNENTKCQSGELYLQSVGSDGALGLDGVSQITPGIHLRWALTGYLGNNHIPKGKLARDVGGPFFSNAGYNRNEDDFVYIYRTEYENPPFCELDFNQAPFEFMHFAELQDWDSTYSAIGISLDPTHMAIIHLALGTNINSFGYFTNVRNDLYNSSVSLKDFLTDYGNLFSIHIIKQTSQGYVPTNHEQFFALEITAANSHYLNDPTIDLCRYAIERKDLKRDDAFGYSEVFEYGVKGNLFIADQNPIDGTFKKKIFSEQMCRSHFNLTNGKIDKLRFELYTDFIFDPSKNWDKVKEFSLAYNQTDDSEIVERLKGKNNAYNIDKSWPRYNDGVVMNADNYITKWNNPTNPTESVKSAVAKYLTESALPNNSRGIGQLDDGLETSKVSFVDILNLLSLDFHVARMLGFGHIDKALDPTKKYVHLAFYKCPSNAVWQAAALDEHYFMSLPTSFNDLRPPFTPTLDEFTHNVPTQDDCSNDKIVDELGYSHFDETRCINLNRAQYAYENIGNDPSVVLNTLENNFNISGENTKVCFYGVEYGLSNIAGVPELLNVVFQDSEIFNGTNQYKDFLLNNNPVDETILIPEKTNSLYSHRERQSGDHQYALYGVNWFSRASEKSNTKNIATAFIQKGIKPPTDLAVQLIQEEEPRVFTTAQEQGMLEARKISNPNDPYITRAVFSWSNFQISNYQFANEVHFYFRNALPIEIKGKINSIAKAAEPHLYEITTKSFNLVNTSPQKTIAPLIAASVSPSIFIGSRFVTKSGSFIIKEAYREPNGFIRLKIQEELIVDKVETIDSETGLYSYESVCSYDKPEVDELFSLTENLNTPSSWYKLTNPSNKVILTNFTNNGITYSESYLNAEGSEISVKVGGIYQKGKITLITTSPYDFQSGKPPCYLIELNYSLPLNPIGNSTNVEFYGGIVRVKDIQGNMRPLSVFKIDGFGTSNLKLYAYDAEGKAQNVVLTGNNNMDINFHPSYKIYLTPEGDFSKTNILPNGDNMVRKTIIAAKPFDGSNSYYTSTPSEVPFSAPSMLTSIKQVNVLPPATPYNESKFATKPDSYGKASYTFDTEVDLSVHKPFSISFHRANDEAILRTLYTSDKIFGANGIKSKLNAIDSNDAEDQRWQDLINVVFNTNSSAFKSYNDYALPMPNNVGIVSEDSTSIKKTKIKAAIYTCFVPISHTPYLYDFIKENTSKQTSNKKPVTTDLSGKLLKETDAEFNPFPSCIKFIKDGKIYLRFTDYTLDGRNQNRYFYHTKEVGSNLKQSEPSGILGPVNVINTSPFDSPYIKKHEIVLDSPYLDTHSGIRFSINPYPIESGVKFIDVYRTLNQGLTADISSMYKVGRFDIDSDIVDYFDDYQFVPAEETFFYRLVAVRPMRNEIGGYDYALSKPSDTIKLQAVSARNPSPPLIEVASYDSISPEMLVQGLRLKWNKTTYKGLYKLYKLTPNGNWNLILEYQDTSTDNNYIVSDSKSIGDISLIDEDDNPIYHIFKVDVTSRSGLLNTEINEYCVNEDLRPKVVLMNDDFSSHTSGWWYAGATMQLDNGRLKCTSQSGASRIFCRVYNTVPNQWHSFIVTLDLGTANGVRLYAKKENSADPSDEIATMTVSSSGRYKLRFKAVGTYTDVHAEFAPWPQPTNYFWIDDAIVEV